MKNLTQFAKIDKYIYLQNSSINQEVKNIYSVHQSDKLGQGSYGTVYKVTHLLTGKIRAMKVLQKSHVEHKERLRNEVQTMYQLDHPNIISLYESFEDEKQIYMVMNICEGGDIFDKVLELCNFTESQAQIIFVQMIRAIHHYQSINVVQRDLKPENFLFKKSNDLSELVLIDFGLAITYNSQTDKLLTTKAGTAYYVAPEVLAGFYDEKCDIWSVGVLLYVILCGYPPFYGEIEQDILFQIKKGDFEFDGPEWEFVQNSVKELIKQVLIKPENRITIKEILKHPWIEEYISQQKQSKQTTISKVFTQAKLLKFASYSLCKKFCLYYLATQLDQEVKYDIKEGFLYFDRDLNGHISFQVLVEELNVPEEQKETFLQACRSVDLSHSEYITYSIFLAMCIDDDLYLNKSNLIHIYSFLQYDERTQINRESLIKKLCLHYNIYKVDQKNITDIEILTAQTIFDQLDYDHDGKIDFEDFTKMMKEEQ